MKKKRQKGQKRQEKLQRRKHLMEKKLREHRRWIQNRMQKDAEFREMWRKLDLQGRVEYLRKHGPKEMLKRLF